MDILEQIRADTARTLGAADPNDTGEKDDLALEYINDQEVYELIATAEPPDPEVVEEAPGEGDRAGLSLQIIYGWNVFFVGNAVYFYYVNQANSYQCTSQAMRWSSVNGSQIVRRCASNGRWIYQLARWL